MESFIKITANKSIQFKVLFLFLSKFMISWLILTACKNRSVSFYARLKNRVYSLFIFKLLCSCFFKVFSFFFFCIYYVRMIFKRVFWEHKWVRVYLGVMEIKNFSRPSKLEPKDTFFVGGDIALLQGTPGRRDLFIVVVLLMMVEVLFFRVGPI